VVIAYPHTSNWDFPVTLLALAALPYGAKWGSEGTRCFAALAVRSCADWAAWPSTGAERTGFVERIADEFRNRDGFHLIIATEGTRSLQPGWKSGFYRIALAAGVPVIMAVVDYGNREVGLLATIMLTGDEAADMAQIATCYEGRRGYRHEQASPIKLL
jgi:1-acyl-sn-glycerol-3-phosphate acyltransferase